MITNASDPIDIIKEKGWLKINDMDQLSVLCKELIAKNAEKVSFYFVPLYYNITLNNLVLHSFIIRPSLYKMEIQSCLNGLSVRQWVVQGEWPILVL